MLPVPIIMPLTKALVVMLVPQFLVEEFELLRFQNAIPPLIFDFKQYN